MSDISIRGARTHNLKNIDLDLPRNKLIVFTGLSGSGKSSLAFDTLYAEGQRRYVESLSAYARQFLSIMEKPEVDHIEGLSPAISIGQRTVSHNPRSTVGTNTEIYDYLRLLYARVGEPRCPTHHLPLEAQTISQMVDTVLALPIDTKLMLLAPVVEARKGEQAHLLAQLRRQGFVRVRIDGKVMELDDSLKLELRKKHTIEVIIDRIKVREDLRLRLTESFETALALSEGIAKIAYLDKEGPEKIFSANFACALCGYSLSELEPRLFSFNNPAGACPTCNGLGVKQFFDPSKIIMDEKLSLAQGAIRGWDHRNFYYFQLLKSLAKHYDFNINAPYAELNSAIKNKLLFGSDDEDIDFHFMSEGGKVIHKIHPFEGVIPSMERRYKETESTAVRENLNNFLTVNICHDCKGTRLRCEARNVFIADKSLPEITEMSIFDAHNFLKETKLAGRRGKIAQKILKEIESRLNFLISVGLDYLTLSRSADTLSGGEMQRIRLASQIGSGLVGVMYILDEPSIGLHQRDNERLIQTLTRLRNLGNTVIVVEHDEDAIRHADYVVDIGPGAGIHGGKIVATGPPHEIINNPHSLTGQYLAGKQKINPPGERVNVNRNRILRLKGAQCNNLKNIDVDIPIGLMTCITGVSGSGKSSLINDTLYPILASALNNATTLKPTPYSSITGLKFLDKVVDINQSPIGRTPRSNSGTYTGLFTPIRELFAITPEARSRGYTPGRFSFNVRGGRCEACEGEGVLKVEMHFLADIYVTCDVCKGKRYNRETLDICYKDKNIHQILEMTVEEARIFFDAIPQVARKLQTLLDVGLNYISLGQSATTLSGGEAQRVKLARELSKRGTGNTLYILDEPTTGLHFHDIKQLLAVLHQLRDQGNTIIVIEHNLDVIKTADWIIDLGPEGGAKGGQVIAQSTPEELIKNTKSYTGLYLKALLQKDKG
jgi:excinuclease ABC subunit A